MDKAKARELAESHVPDDMVVLPDHSQECEFGFYFVTDSRAHQETRAFKDVLVGSCGIIVDRLTGEVHTLGSAFDPEYWFEAYRRRLHLPNTVIITKVLDRQRAADALCRLQMTSVNPKEENGVTWQVPQSYSSKQFLETFNNLPARFENQGLIFRLREIERIEKGNDVEITIKPTSDDYSKSDDIETEFRLFDSSAVPVSFGSPGDESHFIPLGWILLWIIVIALVTLLFWIVV